MKKIVITIILVLSISSACLAENEVTVDPNTFEITIPTLVQLGQNYSVKFSYNGSCFTVKELIPKSNTAATGTKVTLTHDGFDFSAGIISSSWDEIDGYITVWAPQDYPAGYEYGKAFWWTPAAYDNSITHILDMGEVALSSITSVPGDWSYVSGTGNYPLIVNHAYVIKAKDGYAKFKVSSLNGLNSAANSTWDPMKWEIKGEYEFTTGASF